MIRVRPMLPGDLDAVRAVSIRNGLSSFDPDEVRESWLLHPFRECFAGVPYGWVLESVAGEIVGTFSNVHMLYELNGRKVKAGIAGSWAVDVAYRNSSLLLAMSYFNQKGVDVCLNGSASAVASRLMPTLKARRIPSPDYDLSYFWIVNRRAFVGAALRKKKIPCVGVLSRAAAMGLWAWDLQFIRPKRKPPGIKRLSGFGHEFDAFWERLRQKPGLLSAVRTSAALDWRFGGALRRQDAVVLGLFNGQELRGYVLLRKFVRPHLGLNQFVIADLQALNDSPTVLLDLLAAALEATAEEGMDALEWQGWNTAKRALAISLHPRPFRYSVWPLYYKVVNADLASMLANAECWDFSPFDAF
jgi:hypothetical protein